MQVYLHNMKVSLFGLLEIRVKRAKATQVALTLCKNWSFMTNHGYHPGGRIWVIRKADVYTVNISLTTDQLIHRQVEHRRQKLKMDITMLYGINDNNERKRLWTSIMGIYNTIRGSWPLIGDFNNVLNV